MNKDVIAGAQINRSLSNIKNIKKKKGRPIIKTKMKVKMGRFQRISSTIGFKTHFIIIIILHVIIFILNYFLKIKF